MTLALLAAGTVLIIEGEMISGWILLGFALLAFLTLLGMVTADATANRKST